MENILLHVFLVSYCLLCNKLQYLLVVLRTQLQIELEHIIRCPLVLALLFESKLAVRKSLVTRLIHTWSDRF